MIKAPDGLLMAARYARPPNALHYCGPEKQTDLSTYISRRFTDPGLWEILSQFETLYPYLTLIAGANRIKDPFDPRVVEAYFIGNGLLEAVSLRAFDRFLDDSLYIKKKLTGRERLILRETFADALPHHTYHVLSVFRRTAHASAPHTLATMNSCRISWGKVKKIAAGFLTVASRQLVYEKDHLALSMPVEILVKNDLTHVKVGDIVSFHWQEVCSKLTGSQCGWLSRITGRSVILFNKRYDDLPRRQRTVTV